MRSRVINTNKIQMKHSHRTLGALVVLASLSPVFAYGVRAEEVRSTTTVNGEVKISSPLERRVEERKPELKQPPLMEKRNEIKDMRGDLKTEVKQLRASTTEGIKEKREEMKDKVKEVRQEFRANEARNRVNNVTRVLTATAERLNGIIVRMESRIAKLKAAGGSTLEAESSISLAKSDLLIVKTNVDAINSLDLSGSTTTAQANFETIKTDAGLARESLTSARKNLEKALQFLMKIEKTVKVKEGNGTTTATSTGERR